MTCEELREEYGAYALGVAEDPERAEISEHLARNCPNCVPGIRHALSTVAAMSGAVPMIEPPKHLRRRVVAMVAPSKVRAAWPVILPWAVAAALAIALALVTAPALRQSSTTAKLEQALSILNDPSVKEVTFGEPAKPAKGRVFVSGSKGVVFIAANLPRIDRTRIFELWVIPARGNPIPAGTFRGEADSTAVYVHPGPISNAAAIAVTVEPEGGSPQPTTTPFIVTPLTGP
jgi:anti-sigma-K factor RskA